MKIATFPSAKVNGVGRTSTEVLYEVRVGAVTARVYLSPEGAREMAGLLVKMADEIDRSKP